MSKQMRWPLRYGVALLAVVAAIAMLLIPMIGKGMGAVLFLAVLISVWYGGLGPGVFATVLIGAVAAFVVLFLEPDKAPWRFVSIFLFGAGGVLITLLVEALHAAQARAEASRRWLEAAVLESALDCVIAIDHQGKVIEFNPAAEKTFGYRRSEAVGRALVELVIPPACREQHQRGLVHDLATGQGRVLGKRIEMLALRADGSTFPVEFAVVRIPGEPPSFTAYLRDLTERRHAEADRARLAAIVDSSDDAIIGKDLDGIITSWNAGAQRIFGYTAAEILGRPIDLLIPMDCRDQESEILERLRRGERVGQIESVRITKDGRAINVSTTVSPIRDDTGRIVGASRIIRDLTERKRADQALEQRALLLDQAFEPILVWELGGTITYWNEGACKLYGFTAAEALGQVSHELLRTVFPAGFAAYEAALRQHGHWDGELRHQTQDGRWVTVDSHQVLLQQPGQPGLVLEANRDITRRRQAEEQLRGSEQMLAQSQRMAHVGSWACRSLKN
jgi:PAS domain S-box-containing protein